MIQFEKKIAKEKLNCHYPYEDIMLQDELRRYYYDHFFIENGCILQKDMQ